MGAEHGAAREKLTALGFTFAGLGALGGAFYAAGLWWGLVGAAGVICLVVSGHIHSRIRKREIQLLDLEEILSAVEERQRLKAAEAALVRPSPMTSTWPRDVN